MPFFRDVVNSSNTLTQGTGKCVGLKASALYAMSFVCAGLQAVGELIERLKEVTAAAQAATERAEKRQEAQLRATIVSVVAELGFRRISSGSSGYGVAPAPGSSSRMISAVSSTSPVASGSPPASAEVANMSSAGSEVRSPQG